MRFRIGASLSTVIAWHNRRLAYRLKRRLRYPVHWLYVLRHCTLSRRRIGFRGAIAQGDLDFANWVFGHGVVADEDIEICRAGKSIFYRPSQDTDIFSSRADSMGL